LTIIAGAIVFFSIDRRIHIHPGMIREMTQFKTLAEVETYLGGPPGDYTSVPYSFDPPDTSETPLQKEQRDRFLRSFADEGRTRRMWITDEGCIIIALSDSGRIVASGQTKVYLSRKPTLVEKLKSRFAPTPRVDSLPANE